MSILRLQHDADKAVTLFLGEQLLCRYVYKPEVDAKESPKPYFHPVNSLEGDTCTNFRPNDHPWHHALCYTLNNVSGMNFWGGPTCLADGYKWRNDHGSQQHVEWQQLEAEDNRALLSHRLAWRRLDETIFTEQRSIEIVVNESENIWSLRFRSQLTNVSGLVLTLCNPQVDGGLKGSHYCGLEFRAARALLDDHLDDTIKVIAEGGLSGVEAVHGASANWMEWHGQFDTTLNRLVIRFANNDGPLHWFLRRNYPLAAFPLQYESKQEIAIDGIYAVDHTISFQSVKP